MFKIENKNGEKSVYLFNKKILKFGCKSNKDLYNKISSIEGLMFSYIQAKDIPKANGVLRDIQLGQLKMLKEIDRICKKHNLVYWLDFGTLLGAVRHQGFIPWDDDVDICMLRDDYQRFIDIFKNECCIDELDAFLFSHRSGKANLIKVMHKRIDNLFVDIFPVDIGYKNMNYDEKLFFSDRLKNLSEKHAHKMRKFNNVKDWHDSYLTLRDKEFGSILKKEEETDPQIIFYGLEFYHRTHKYNVFDYSMIFPLKEISFEGCKFPCVNKVDIYMTLNYGDYMVLPRNYHVHRDLSALSVELMLEVKSFINREN